MKGTIFLVRHGEIDLGGEKRYIGSTNLPLCQRGIEDARKLKEYFSNKDLQEAYTSPLLRCIETSEIIIKGRGIEKKIVNDLREIHLGEWEYKTFAYIRNNFPKEYEERGRRIDSYQCPGGESFQQVHNRVIPAFKRLVQAGGDDNILLVAHAGVNRVILGHIFGIPLSKIMDIHQPYGCVNKLLWDKDRQRWNYDLLIL